MRPTLRWPVRTDHEKCNSDTHVFVSEVAVEASGYLVIKCYCDDCGDEFVLKLSMLQLVAEAAVSDKETLGDLVLHLPGTWPAHTKPN